MGLIIAALALSAIYSGGMYAYVAYLFFTGRVPVSEGDRVELHTFHFGLCFILSLGFLGLLVK